jgi:hypothetical protein
MSPSQSDAGQPRNRIDGFQIEMVDVAERGDLVTCLLELLDHALGAHGM